jgi:hypothetical protein
MSWFFFGTPNAFSSFSAHRRGRNKSERGKDRRVLVGLRVFGVFVESRIFGRRRWTGVSRVASNYAAGTVFRRSLGKVYIRLLMLIYGS